jgi:hypothetical protein
MAELWKEKISLGKELLRLLSASEFVSRPWLNASCLSCMRAFPSLRMLSLLFLTVLIAGLGKLMTVRKICVGKRIKQASSKIAAWDWVLTSPLKEMKINS